MKVLSLLDTVFWMMVGFGSMMSSGFFEGLRKTMMIVSELRSGLGDNYTGLSFVLRLSCVCLAFVLRFLSCVCLAFG